MIKDKFEHALKDLFTGAQVLSQRCGSDNYTRDKFTAKLHATAIALIFSRYWPRRYDSTCIIIVRPIYNMRARLQTYEMNPLVRSSSSYRLLPDYRSSQFSSKYAVILRLVTTCNIIHFTLIAVVFLIYSMVRHVT